MPTSQKGSGTKTASQGSDLFRQTVLCHSDLVFRVAVRLCGEATEAEDLVQETFLRAHRAFDRFDLRDHGAKPWLLKILHNVVRTRRSKVRRQPTLLEDVNFDDFAAELEREPLPRLADGQMRWEGFDDELKRAVEGLIPEYREVLLLWALGDLSYKQIADIADVPIGTVMSRLYRARQQLCQELATYAAGRRIASERTPAP
jgi:RNA polymerase sigma-70 factor (ECF subfamily)